ncbi:hypothetical protein CRG98_023854 [Punica granatum]|uniref:Uncharacterized protein n=1 Tax=Punica granatum TaxID=22663 RepID=A0A2I0JIF6_PUNGR|nr:hypothetical protein CRG98_023854 [Punica granatum]
MERELIFFSLSLYLSRNQIPKASVAVGAFGGPPSFSPSLFPLSLSPLGLMDACRQRRPRLYRCSWTASLCHAKSLAQHRLRPSAACVSLLLLSVGLPSRRPLRPLHVDLNRAEQLQFQPNRALIGPSSTCPTPRKLRY